jgi:phosphohistidine phosphatase SixA
VVAALGQVVEALAQAQRLEEARYLATRIATSQQRARAFLTIAAQHAALEQWDTLLPILCDTAALDRHAAVRFISTLPHLPTVQTLVQQLWSQAQTRDDLYALLRAATPLFAADPTLLPQILAGEQWVQEQLTW